MVDSTEPLALDPLTVEEEKTFHPRALTYRLEVLSGPAAGTTLIIERPLTVGTSEECELRLVDSTVSRKHARLQRDDQGVSVKDLGSKNGTFLAGSRVEGFVVRREATFSVGSTLLRLSGVPRQEPPAGPPTFGAALGTSPAMQAVFASLRAAAPTMSSVLLMGETGTGKEVLARAIHEASPRRHRPFIVVDCGALTPSLIESELFGHVKGSFTGAAATRDGAFATANGGTIFLDELGELPAEQQPKLLRVLESRTVRRVGEDVARPVDVRVIAATHRDLEAEVRAGRFREDLYFRTAVVVVKVPSLRDRLEDLELLSRSILTRMGRPNFELSAELLAQLRQHAWPGNVRELRNVIERALSGGETVDLGSKAVPAAAASTKPFKQAKEELVEEFTREYFARLLAASDGNVSEMARVAGIARPYAHEVVRKYGLKR